MGTMNYSEELADLVKKFLDEDGWAYSFNEDTGTFKFDLRIKSKLQKISYVVGVREAEILAYGVCPIIADSDSAEMMSRMAEFICRANYGLKNGCFELDYRDGEVRFKSYIDCRGTIPSQEVIKNSIYCAAAMFRRYGDGIVSVVFSDCKPEEAIAICEKPQA